MPKTSRKVGILCGGRDCPGAGEVVAAACAAAWTLGWEVQAIDGGFGGFLANRPRRLDRDANGTKVLESAQGDRADPFQYPVKSGRFLSHADRSAEVVRTVRAAGLAGVIVIGGEGTLGLADRFHRRGVPVVGIPKNIEAVQPAGWGLGFDSQIAAATGAIEQLRRSAEAAGRIMLAEVLGRETGWWALQCGLAAGAQVILLPEIPYRLESVAEHLRLADKSGTTSPLVVVAQGARPAGASPALAAGATASLSGDLAKRLRKEIRVFALGPLQEGAAVTTADRVLARRLGAAAMRLVDEGRFGNMVAHRPAGIEAIPLHQLDGRRKVRVIPLESDWLRTARDLGAGFGE